MNSCNKGNFCYILVVVLLKCVLVFLKKIIFVNQIRVFFCVICDVLVGYVYQFEDKYVYV